MKKKLCDAVKAARLTGVSGGGLSTAAKAFIQDIVVHKRTHTISPKIRLTSEADTSKLSSV